METLQNREEGLMSEGSPSLSFSFGKFGWEKTIFKDSHAAAARVSCVSLSFHVVVSMVAGKFPLPFLVVN